MRRLSLLAGAAWASALTLLSAAVAAGGPGDQDRAAALYDEGVRAFDRGEVGRAAQAFAEADSLAPNTVALAAAFDAAVQADDAVLGAELCARAAQRSLPQARDATGRAACRSFESRVGRVVLECHRGPCSARIGSLVVVPERVAFVEPGEHVVELRGQTGVRARRVDVPAGAVVLLGDEATLAASVAMSPTPGPPAPVPEPTGIGSGWFLAGVGLTALLVGASVGSAVDTSARHDAFITAGCPSPGADSTACGDLADSGEGAELRTNTLLVSAAVIGAGTLVLGLVTDWDSEPPAGGALSGRAAWTPTLLRWH